MAASSSEGQTNDFEKFIQEWRKIKSKNSHSTGGISIVNNGADYENIETPISFLIEIDNSNSICSILKTMDIRQKNLFSYIKGCTDIMPGFPGGGRSFIEIPIYCNLFEVFTITDNILNILKHFRESFKYDQIFENYIHFVKTDKRININIINDPSFLTCLPENGGSPQINIGLKNDIRGMPILYICVDSYWQPAIKLFKSAYKKVEEYCFSEDVNNSSFDIKKTDTLKNVKYIYWDIKNTLSYEYSREFYQKIYEKEDEDLDLKSNRTKKNIHFISPNFAYCEYLSFLHRNAILTILIGKISQIKNSKGNSIVGNYEELLSSQYTLPSLSKNCCEILRTPELHLGDKPIFIKLIDKIYIKNAVHSTIRFSGNGFHNEMDVFITKRVFNEIDFLNGSAFVFVGATEYGFCNSQIKTESDIEIIKSISDIKFIASKSLENQTREQEYSNINQDYIYVANSCYDNSFSILSAEIFVHPWIQINKTLTGTQNTYGIDFNDYNIESDKNNLNTSGREIILFQPFSSEFDFKFSTYYLKNSFLLETAIYEYLKSIFKENYLKYKLRLSILPFFASLWSCKALENFSLEELIQLKRNSVKEPASSSKSNIIENKLIISTKHFKDLDKFKKGKSNFKITTSDRIYGDTDNTDDLKLSNSSALILKKQTRKYTRTFTEIKFSYRQD